MVKIIGALFRVLQVPLSDAVRRLYWVARDARDLFFSVRFVDDYNEEASVLGPSREGAGCVRPLIPTVRRLGAMSSTPRAWSLRARDVLHRSTHNGRIRYSLVREVFQLIDGAWTQVDEKSSHCVCSDRTRLAERDIYNNLVRILGGPMPLMAELEAGPVAS